MRPAWTVVLAAAALAPGCRPHPATTGPAPAERPADAAARRLVGEWQAGADPWQTLTFRADGTYCWEKRYDGPPGRWSEQGAYVVPEAGRLELRPAGEPRRYAVRLSGDELRLEPGPEVWRRRQP